MGSDGDGIRTLHIPRNTLPEITELWCFVSVDGGGEGVVAAPIGGYTMPLIAADRARLESLEPIAEQMAALTGISIRLIRLSHREVIREIEPHAGGRVA